MLQFTKQDNAGVVELVYTLVLGTSASQLAGSSPAPSTNVQCLERPEDNRGGLSLTF